MSYENFPFIFFLPTSLRNFQPLLNVAIISLVLPDDLSTILAPCVNLQSELILQIQICTSLSHIKIFIASQVYSKLLAEVFESHVKVTVQEHGVFTCQKRLAK